MFLKREIFAREAQVRNFISKNYASCNALTLPSPIRLSLVEFSENALRMRILYDDKIIWRQKFFSQMRCDIRLLAIGSDGKKISVDTTALTWWDMFFTNAGEKGKISIAFGIVVINPDIISADINIMRPQDSRMVLQFLLHEVGHALGLGHSNNPADALNTYCRVMYRCDLSHRDANSSRALYGGFSTKLNSVIGTLA